MSATPVQASAPPDGSAACAAAGPGRSGLALAVIATCNAMIQLDDPIVNIALPGMRRELGLSAVDASWVVTAYLLAFGGLLLLGARAGDLLGRRRVFLVGVGLFTAAALLRGPAPGIEYLIVVRAVQGTGAALAASNGLALLLATFPEGTARKKAIAVCTAVGALCAAGGLLLAGSLTALSSWRWVLYLDAPLGLAVLVLAPFALRETARTRGRFDLAGAVLSVLASACVVYGLARAAEHPWSDELVVVSLVTGALALAAFVAVERRAEQPIVPPRLFAHRDRLLAYAGTLAAPGAVIGAYFFLSQFFQAERGWSALAAGCALMPLPATMVLVALVAVRWERRWGVRRLMAGGAVLLVVGNGWLAALDTSDSYARGVLPGLMALGAGMACCVLPATIVATSAVRPGEAGAAAGALNSLQAIGGSIGLATLVTVYTQGFGMAGGFTAGAVFACVALLAAVGMRRAPRPVRLRHVPLKP